MIRRARTWWELRSEAVADEFVTVMVSKAPVWVLVGGIVALVLVVAAIQIGRWVA